MEKEIEDMTVQEMWDDFRVRTIHTSTSPEELERLRIAFYSGMISLSPRVAAIAVSDETPPVRGQEMLKIGDELDEMYRSIDPDGPQFLNGRIAPFAPPPERVTN